MNVIDTVHLSLHSCASFIESTFGTEAYVTVLS